VQRRALRRTVSCEPDQSFLWVSFAGLFCRSLLIYTEASFYILLHILFNSISILFLFYFYSISRHDVLGVRRREHRQAPCCFDSHDIDRSLV